MVVMWFFVLLMGQFLGLGDYLNQNIASPINFQVRQIINGDEIIDPRLKILALGRSCYSY